MHEFQFHSSSFHLFDSVVVTVEVIRAAAKILVKVTEVCGGMRFIFH